MSNPDQPDRRQSGLDDLVTVTLAEVQAERDRLRRLVLRDHAQGHKAHADCPACQKFGVRPNGARS